MRAPAGFGDRVEGLHATAAALAAGRLIRAHCGAGPRRSGAGAGADRPGRPSRRPVVDLVDDVRPEAGTEAPQGVVGVGSPIPYRSLERLGRQSARPWRCWFSTTSRIPTTSVPPPVRRWQQGSTGWSSRCGGRPHRARRRMKAAAGALESAPRGRGELGGGRPGHDSAGSVCGRWVSTPAPSAASSVSNC